MTQEEKAKAYDKVREKIAIRFGSNVADEIFSKFEMSEDERIKKEIIVHIKWCEDNGYCAKEEMTRWIAWLEKQAEQKHTAEEVLIKAGLKPYKDGDQWCVLLGDNIQEGICGFGNTIEDALYAFLKDLIASQGEQKPANKVEPRFKNGQWIVWQNKCYKVNYNGCGYELIDQDGLSTSLEYGTIDENAHLFTIQDAKDGDVLVLNDEVFIYAHRKQVYDIAVAYCFVNSGSGFHFDGEFGYTERGNLVHPATKEQRDLLFTKMHEAGYDWDANKKELKKIEQNLVNSTKTCKDEQKPTDEIEPRFEIEKGKWYVCNTSRYTDFIVGKSYYCPKNGMLKPNENEMARYVARDCFHLWNIQDAKDGDVLVEDSCIFIIQKLGDNSTAAKTYCTLYNDGDFDDGSILYFDIDSTKPATKEQRDTLMKAMADAGWEFDFEKKELKKIEQKLAWSEGDEKHIDSLLERLEGMCKKGATFTKTRFAISQDMDWLKSLKDRIGG